jgi:myo-inositol 2-dehydrogenase/D-chiro-inositol 1-dehydrogenase
MMNERLKIALVGAGGWGLQHARIFQERPDVDFCAIAGRTLERTEARAKQFGVRAYTDIGEMLEREVPDLVSVCLPNEGHFAPTLQVIEAGFPLLVEKPLVFDLAEADTLLSEAESRHLFFAINFNHRYAKPVQMAWQAISEGRLGDIMFATWRFGGEGGVGHPFGNLIETQCHGFDMLEYLCGPIKTVMAEFADRSESGSYQDMVIALKFESGAIGSLVGSYNSSYAYTDTHRVEINGTAGRVLIEDTVRRYSYQAAGSETAEVWSAGYFNDRDREFQRTFDAYIDALRQGQPPPVPASAGRRALRLALASIESFQSGTRVVVQEN